MAWGCKSVLPSKVESLICLVEQEMISSCGQIDKNFYPQ